MEHGVLQQPDTDQGVPDAGEIGSAAPQNVESAGAPLAVCRARARALPRLPGRSRHSGWHGRRLAHPG